MTRLLVPSLARFVDRLVNRPGVLLWVAIGCGALVAALDVALGLLVGEPPERLVRWLVNDLALVALLLPLVLVGWRSPLFAMVVDLGLRQTLSGWWNGRIEITSPRTAVVRTPVQPSP